MAENRSYIQRYAMLFGAYMGIYWLIGSALFPLGLTHPYILLVFMAAVVAGPFIGYHYVKNYRNQACEGAIGFGHAWVFTTLMYVFASLLTAAGHYIYFRFIDHGYLIDTYTRIVNDFFSQGAALAGGMDAYKEQLEQACEQLGALTPIEFTMQLFSNNIFWGILLAIPTALCVMKKKRSTGFPQ